MKPAFPRLRPARLALLATCLGLLLFGCKSDSGLDEKQQAQASRLDRIVKTSGGEWSRVSPADRDYLVKELAQGSETTARMLFSAKAGKLVRPRPGGPGTPK